MRKGRILCLAAALSVPCASPFTDQHIQRIGIPVQLASLVHKALVVLHVV